MYLKQLFDLRFLSVMKPNQLLKDHDVIELFLNDHNVANIFSGYD